MPYPAAQAQLIRGPALQGQPWNRVEDVELALFSWVHWHNHYHLHGYLMTSRRQSSRRPSTLARGPTYPGRNQLPEPGPTPVRFRGRKNTTRAAPRRRYQTVAALPTERLDSEEFGLRPPSLGHGGAQITATAGSFVRSRLDARYQS